MDENEEDALRARLTRAQDNLELAERRVARLLEENRCLMNQNATLNANLTAAQRRGTEHLDAVRLGRRLVNAFVNAEDQDRVAEFDAMQEWAARPA